LALQQDKKACESVFSACSFAAANAYALSKLKVRDQITNSDGTTIEVTGNGKDVKVKVSRGDDVMVMSVL
jgi:hypothetical protein